MQKREEMNTPEYDARKKERLDLIIKTTYGRKVSSGRKYLAIINGVSGATRIRSRRKFIRMSVKKKTEE